jgi:heme A synthase
LLAGLYYSHAISGVFLFCLPVGLILLLVMHKIWKPAVASLLSSDSYVSQELHKSFKFWPLGRLGMVCLAIVIGAFTHLLWDSFTHSYGWMVEHWPALRTSINLGNGISLSLFRLLQHISTIIGISVLVALAVIYRDRIRPVPRKAWAIFILIGVTGLLGGFGLAIWRAGFPVDPRLYYVNGVAASFALVVASVTLLSLAWRVLRT